MTAGTVTGGGRPDGLVEADAAAHVESLLRLAALASAAHDRFVFPDQAAADRFYAELHGRGGADFAPPQARLFLLDGRAAAMIALVPPAARKRSRLAGALMLARSPQMRDDPALVGRLRLVATALVEPGDRDGYLSRLAVDPSASGRGLGRLLLEYAVEDTRRHGLERCVLEVADDNHRALALYRGFGFEEIGRAEVSDPESRARVGYLHLAYRV